MSTLLAGYWMVGRYVPGGKLAEAVESGTELEARELAQILNGSTKMQGYPKDEKGLPVVGTWKAYFARTRACPACGRAVHLASDVDQPDRLIEWCECGGPDLERNV